MTPPSPADSARQGLLEEVLGDYMAGLDRGEVIDRGELLARHPELAAELHSYFATSDEMERLRRPAGGEPPTEPLSRARAEATLSGEGKGSRIGDYELMEQIGEGGMGVIYKARHVSLNRLVALKRIRTDRLALAGDLRRFRSEAEAVARLDHPHIVPIYEVGEHDGQPFFTMKLIEGGSLAQIISRGDAESAENTPVSSLRSLRLCAQLLAAVARAVHYAHQRGLLHRDLKPANILLDAHGQPHVTDFGLAKRLGVAPGEESLTQPGVIVGTPSYMAPEQAASRGGVSTATDVWALGAVLYQLLTGRPPFLAETPLETLLHLLEREPDPPRHLNRHVAPDLETVCLKCLQKDPHNRYDSAQALAEDLERWLAGEPIQARPVGRGERLVKWVRRRPHLAALATLLVLAVLLGFAGVFWQWRRAEAARWTATERADAERRMAYARAIALAYAEWRAGNAGTAGQVLDGCPTDLRAWEWHYLRRLFRVRQLATLEGHADGVLAVAVSTDGARVASGDADGVVKIWERRGSRALLTLPCPAAVTAVAFSAEGKHLVGGCADGTVRIWDAVSGEEVANLRGHTAPVTALAYDPSGERLATTAGEPLRGELTLWDPRKGKVLLSEGWPSLLTGVAFSPDGKVLVTVSRDHSVTAWDATTLKPVRTFEGHTERTVPWASVAFSADGRWLAAGSPEGLVRVWDTTSGRESFTALTPTQAGVSGLAFGGPGGRILAAATADNTIQGWVTRTGKPAFTLRGHARAVKAVAWSRDGLCLISGGLDHTVKVWDVGKPDEDLTLRGLRPTNAGVMGVAFSQDGAHLASVTRDRALNVWDVETGKAVLTLPKLPESVNGVSFNSDNTHVASAGADGTVRLWEVVSGRDTLRLDAGGPVEAVSFGPGGTLAAAVEDGTVLLWETPSGRERLRLRGHDGPAHAVAFSPDGRRIASAGHDGVARVWDAVTGRTHLELSRADGPLHAVAFSLDGRHLATGGRDETVRVWDAATGRLTRVIPGHAGAVRGLAYGPDGRLASVGDDKAVRVWDAAGQALLALRGHAEALRAVAFSPDGCRLASASEDGTVKVWDGTPDR